MYVLTLRQVVVKKLLLDHLHLHKVDFHMPLRLED